MGIARSTYYDAPKRTADDTALVEAIHAIKDEFEVLSACRSGALVDTTDPTRLSGTGRPSSDSRGSPRPGTVRIPYVFKIYRLGKALPPRLS